MLGLAEDGADLAVEQQRLLEAGAGTLVVRTGEGHVSEAIDAVGLAANGADLG
jgi:hypothetical protein